MARTYVVDENEGTRFPFLRGILTRSLQEAGVPFEQAYEVASAIREELSGAEAVSNESLRKKVLRRLDPFGPEVMQSYLGPATPASIEIRFSDGHTTPFSRGRHRLSLASCGLANEDTASAAASIYEDLLAHNVREISSKELRHLTYRHLQDELGDKAARNYLVWESFKRSKRPLVVLIGGGVGSGKSTVAAQLAHRLSIVRIQSTDMLREVMRTMVPHRLLPVLHTSSFMAWNELPTAETRGDGEAPLIEGYLTQSRLVAVACEAVLSRAVRERVSMILEGVHAHPALLEDPGRDSDTIVVRVVLGVLKQRDLRARIRGRGKEEPDRRAKRYLQHFDAIWGLQDFMLSEADRLQVPIVPNVELDRTVQEVLAIVIKALAAEFTGTPEEVF